MYQEDFNLPAKVVERTFSPDLDGLIAWLETQDAATSYDWMDVRGCVMCRFQQARGIPKPWSTGGGLHSPFGKDLRNYHNVCGTWPWTYAAALDRARALREQHP